MPVRIADLRREPHGTSLRAVATVTWEDSPRPSREIWFETSAELDGEFRADPNAFLLACVIPAVRHGEKRVALEGPVCPVLRDGLRTAMILLEGWYGDSRAPLEIESRGGFEAPIPREPSRAAFFLSGGVDSLHLLHSNREKFPGEHRSSFRDAIFVSGRDLPGSEDSPGSRNHLARSLENLMPIAEETGIRIVPVTTNARQLDPDDEFFLLEYFGSFLAAAAMTLSGRWSSVSIASSWDLRHLRPWGSHPLLDPCFGTAAMEIHHEGALLTRFQKLLAISSWDSAVSRLVVCNHAPSPPWLNCGRCNKCLLTLSALLLAGRIERAASFPPESLTPEAIGALFRPAPISRICGGSESDCCGGRGIPLSLRQSKRRFGNPSDIGNGRTPGDGRRGSAGSMTGSSGAGFKSCEAAVRGFDDVVGPDLPSARAAGSSARFASSTLFSACRTEKSRAQERMILR
jgi:hypothetical protein